MGHQGAVRREREGAELLEDEVFQGDARVPGSEPVTSETRVPARTDHDWGWGARAAENSPVVRGVIPSAPMRATWQYISELQTTHTLSQQFLFSLCCGFGHVFEEVHMYRVSFVTSRTASMLQPKCSVGRFLLNTLGQIHVMRHYAPTSKKSYVCVYLPACIHTHTMYTHI